MNRKHPSERAIALQNLLLIVAVLSALIIVVTVDYNKPAFGLAFIILIPLLALQFDRLTDLGAMMIGRLSRCVRAWKRRAHINRRCASRLQKAACAHGLE